MTIDNGDLQVVLGEECHDVHDMSFVICIARSCPVLSPDLAASGKSFKRNCKLHMQIVAISVLIPSCGYSANVCVHSKTVNNDHVEALRVYLSSRSLSRLKHQFQAGKGMVSSHYHQPLFPTGSNEFSVLVFLSPLFQITVDCIEGYPPISLQLGKQVFLSAGDFYLASRSWCFVCSIPILSALPFCFTAIHFKQPSSIYAPLSGC